MFNQYTAIAIVLGVTTIAGLGKLLHSEIQRHGETKAELEIAQTSLDSYISAVEDMRIEQATVSKAIREEQNKYNEVTRELDALKNRESTVLAKKGLVTIKINKAFIKQQGNLACITGDDTACEK